MRHTFVFLTLILIALTAVEGSAERNWVNNITVDENNMTWGYTETFTGADSLRYRVGIDTESGNNDSFITAWELLKLDKEMRKRLRSSIDSEFDVRINNETAGIEVVDVDSVLSPGIIGKTHIGDTIVNRYKVTYRWKGSILNARSIWFLGQAKSPVTVIIPAGVDVTNISGMDNVTKIISDHVEITGAFRGVSEDVSENRGEITLYLEKNTSNGVKPDVNVTATLPRMSENATKPMTRVVSKIRDGSILGAGVVIILLIYVFKVKKR